MLYDIITAVEKQATRSGICFSAVINKKAFDEVKHRVRKHELSSLDDIMSSKNMTMVNNERLWRQYG
ncbi:MAG: hypothetical protein K2K96_06005 [Lachnospiraceae bacterium]|nr:hypothetical protein [Lachnospiraceae bacterium]